MIKESSLYLTKYHLNRESHYSVLSLVPRPSSLVPRPSCLVRPYLLHSPSPSPSSSPSRLSVCLSLFVALSLAFSHVLSPSRLLTLSLVRALLLSCACALSFAHSRFCACSPPLSLSVRLISLPVSRAHLMSRVVLC